jgi:hypothetical protein
MDAYVKSIDVVRLVMLSFGRQPLVENFDEFHREEGMEWKYFVASLHDMTAGFIGGSQLLSPTLRTYFWCLLVLSNLSTDSSASTTCLTPKLNTDYEGNR